MFFYLYNGFGIYIKFETNTLVFLTGSYDHAFSFFSGCKHIRLFLHQPDTSLRLFCNVTSISFTVFPLVSRNESSANREFLTFLSCMCSGRSFINMQNSRGPRILPCGTPDCMVPTADNLPFTQTYCDLSDWYDWKKGMTEELFKYTLTFCCRGCVIH